MITIVRIFLKPKIDFKATINDTSSKVESNPYYLKIINDLVNLKIQERYQ